METREKTITKLNLLKNYLKNKEELEKDLLVCLNAGKLEPDIYHKFIANSEKKYHEFLELLTATKER